MIRPQPLLLLVCMLVLAVDLLAQQPNRETTIAGRVLTSDGSPLAGFGVALRPLGVDINASRYQRTDSEGKFSFDSLTNGPYTLLAFDVISQDMQFDLGDDGNPSIHRPGDVVELLIRREKPGVITGAVTGTSGEPIVEAIIQAVKIRDSDGKPTYSPVNLAAQNLQRKTDDRGVYRLWGLEPGSYLISAGGKSRGRSMLSAYDADAPTYYSDSSASHKPVPLGPGQEVSGIDIQYRGGSGHKVSGVFSGSYHQGTTALDHRQTDREGSPLAAVLTDTMTGEQQSSAIDMAGATPGSFAFSELSDGEYEITVVNFAGPGARSEAASESKRLTVKGVDVAGIQLKPVMLGTISGRIAVEPPRDLKPGCVPKAPTKLDQAALVFSRTEQSPAPRRWSPFSLSSIEVRVDSQGNFPSTRLEPGPYRIKIYFPDDTFYLESITLGAPSKPAPTGAPSKPAPLGPILSIKAAQEISPVIISLGMGAARVSGHILAPPGGAPLPASLVVYLVPAIAEHADNPLRFSSASVRTGGAFVLASIPPGRYRILARPGARDSDQPVIESKDGRAALRREAERTGVALEFSTCQKLADFALTYAPQ